MSKLTILIATVVLLTACAKERPEKIITTPPQSTLFVTATAYNSTVAQTDGRPTEAAWGDKLYPGVQAIAVSRDLEAQGLTTGTLVNIDGLEGVWTVTDRMAARKKNTIDIYMGKDIKAAREWGRRKVLIRWVPGAAEAQKVKPEKKSDVKPNS